MHDLALPLGEPRADARNFDIAEEKEYRPCEKAAF